MNPSLSACLISIAALAGFADVRAGESDGKPNVLFLMIDDLRPALGCYGDTQVKSPNIDRLAMQSCLFERAYCQVPVCGGSRASLMTGILPTSTRFKVARTKVDEQAPSAATLPQVFREDGYETLSIGKVFHYPGDTGSRSWSEPAWQPETGNRSSILPETTKELSAKGRGLMFEAADVADNQYPDGMVAEKAIAKLKALKKSGKPFFLACGFLRPHMPFYAPKRYWDLYDRNSLAIAPNLARPKGAPNALKGSTEYLSYGLGGADPKSPSWHRAMRHGYYASVSYSDKLVGDVLDELDRLDLAKNTIVVLWGDHGWNLGEHQFWGKHNTMHHSVRVPLMIRLPGQATGVRSAALVETSDIFPTLCGLADIRVPATVQGASFETSLDDPSKVFRKFVFSRYGKGEAVISEHFAYTSYGDDGEMLFDHRKDPDENRNVAGDPEYRETLEAMRAYLGKSKQRASRF